MIKEEEKLVGTQQIRLLNGELLLQLQSLVKKYEHSVNEMKLKKENLDLQRNLFNNSSNEKSI